MSQLRLSDGQIVETHQVFGMGTLVVPTTRRKTKAGHWRLWSLQDKDFHQTVDQANNPSRTPIRHLVWLIKHNFILATWTCVFDSAEGEYNHLFIRIYVLPEDINGGPGIQSAVYARHSRISESLKHWNALLPHVSRDVEAWNALHLGPFNLTYFSDRSNACSLVDIYQSLPSPSPSPPTIFSSSPPIIPRALVTCQKGMISVLHSYQQRSLARMLEIEVPDSSCSSSRQPSPLYVPIECLESGTTFYVNPARFLCRHSRPIYAPPRGGVLCENMGVGKTIICLALILSTIGHLSQPDLPPSSEDLDDDDGLDDHHQYGPVDEERIRICQPAKRPDSTKSLAVIALSVFRSAPYQATGRNRLGPPPQYSLVPDHVAADLLSSEFQPYYRPVALNPSSVKERASRKPQAPLPPKMYLTNATLAIIPPNLVGQWTSEIAKHVKPGVLRLLNVDPKIPLPESSELANGYDLVLMTTDRFVTEMSKTKLGKDYVSPLRNIHWLRIMVDEGNICANHSNTMLEARQLKAQRRWVVTGTPTTNLVSLGNEYGVLNIPDTQDEEVELLVSEPLVTGILPPYFWTSADRADLNKLGSMVAGFLGVHLTSMIGGIHQMVGSRKGETDLFVDQIINPLFASRWGSVQVLKQFLALIMIKHRFEDIEQEVTLPPKTQEDVVLDMDEYQCITYNVMQAALAVNAIDSERRDKDYIFHPDNARWRTDYVLNTLRACFWHYNAEFFDKDLASILKTSENSIQTAIRRGSSQADIDLVVKASQYLRYAFNHKLWRSMMRVVQIPFRVTGLPAEHRDAWLRLDHTDYPLPQEQHIDEGYFLSNLFSLREAGKECNLDEERMVFKGNQDMNKIAAEEAGVQYQVLDRKSPSSGRRTSPMSDSSVNSVSASSSSTLVSQADRDVRPSPRKKKSSKPSRGKSQHGKPANMTNAGLLAVDTTEDLKVAKMVSAEKTVQDRDGIVLSSTDPNSRLLKARVRNSTSPKLNFIIAEVLRHPGDKFLIFSAFLHSLSHIRTGLEVARVSSLLLSGLSKYESQAGLHAFESSNKYQVLLLDLKTGARGLNLVSANRVIFVEPVFHADVESQAVKRVHRIGQQQPVHIITLAMRGTVEEKAIYRRKQSDRTEKVLEKDEIMMDYMANPKFLEAPKHSFSTLVDSRANVDISLFAVEATPPNEEARNQLFKPSKDYFVILPNKRHHEEQYNQNEVLTGSPPKKRKVRLVISPSKESGGS